MCGIAGFALESKCHVGKKIVYDTVGRLGWSVDVRTHSIRVIVDRLLKEDWGKQPKEELASEADFEEDAVSERRFGWWPGRGKNKKPAGGDDGDGDDSNGGENGADDGDRNGDKEDPPTDPGGEEKDDGQHGGRGVPQAVFEDENCVDCSQWTYV